MDLSAWAGRWQGAWRTWVEPAELHNESAIDATVEALYGGKGALLRYTATLDGPVAGLALLGATQDGVVVAWMDTWHTSGLVMASHGRDQGDRIEVVTPFRAEGEQWLWHSEYHIDDRGRLLVRHFNEGPALPRYLGVEMVLERIGD